MKEYKQFAIEGCISFIAIVIYALINLMRMMSISFFEACNRLIHSGIYALSYYVYLFIFLILIIELFQNTKQYIPYNIYIVLSVLLVILIIIEVIFTSLVSLFMIMILLSCLTLSFVEYQIKK